LYGTPTVHNTLLSLDSLTARMDVDGLRLRRTVDIPVGAGGRGKTSQQSDDKRWEEIHVRSDSGLEEVPRSECGDRLGAFIVKYIIPGMST
jgi:hypothetical protein